MVIRGRNSNKTSNGESPGTNLVVQDDLVGIEPDGLEGPSKHPDHACMELLHAAKSVRFLLHKVDYGEGGGSINKVKDPLRLAFVQDSGLA
jgi:hypothetical protein